MRKMWAVAREMGWDSERLHRYVGIQYGVESLKLLSRATARRLIDELERFARPPATRRYRERGLALDEDGKLSEYATPAQLAKMRAVAGRLDWGDAWLRAMATRTFKRPVTDLRRLRFQEAMKLVNVVEGLVMRREQERRQKEMFGRMEDGGERTEEADGENGDSPRRQERRNPVQSPFSQKEAG